MLEPVAAVVPASPNVPAQPSGDNPASAVEVNIDDGAVSYGANDVGAKALLASAIRCGDAIATLHDFLDLQAVQSPPSLRTRTFVAGSTDDQGPLVMIFQATSNGVEPASPGQPGFHSFVYRGQPGGTGFIELTQLSTPLTDPVAFMRDHSDAVCNTMLFMKLMRTPTASDLDPAQPDEAEKRRILTDALAGRTKSAEPSRPTSATPTVGAGPAAQSASNAASDGSGKGGGDAAAPEPNHQLDHSAQATMPAEGWAGPPVARASNDFFDAIESERTCGEHPGWRQAMMSLKTEGMRPRWPAPAVLAKSVRSTGKASSSERAKRYVRKKALRLMVEETSYSTLITTRYAVGRS